MTRLGVAYKVEQCRPPISPLIGHLSGLKVGTRLVEFVGLREDVSPVFGGLLVKRSMPNDLSVEATSTSEGRPASPPV